MPEIEKSRYYDVQLVDMYTDQLRLHRQPRDRQRRWLLHGRRAGLEGRHAPGRRKVFRSETQFSLVIYRTQLFNPADMDNVKRIQAGYKVQTLSAFLGKPAPPPAPAIEWPKFEQDAFTTRFGDYLDFLLQFCPPTGTAAEEKPLREKFAAIGIGAGQAPVDSARTAAGAEGRARRCGEGGLRKDRGDGAIRSATTSTAGRSARPPATAPSTTATGPAARGRGQARHLRQRCGRGGLSLRPQRRERPAARRQPAQLHADLRPGRIAAGQRLLVGHDVRRARPSS